MPNSWWVYPTSYSKLFYDFREALAEAAVTARKQQAGIWTEVSTLTGFALTGSASSPTTW